MHSLAKKFSYKANINYLINASIKEYDLEKAILGLLYQIGRLNEEQYNAYAETPKEKRIVEIGCYMKTDPSLFDLTQMKMSEIRNAFLTENQIEEYQVLYVDNDSMTIIEPKDKIHIDDKITNFGEHINFRVKNVYTSFYRLSGIDLLYNSINGSYRLKYANINVAQKTQDGFLDLILTLAYEAESSLLSALQTAKDAYLKYTNFELPIEYYRELNQKAQFKLKPGLAYTYYTEIDPGISLDQLDISYNAGLLNYMIRILSKEYFNSIR